MLIILNIISVLNYHSKRKKERKKGRKEGRKEILSFHVKTEKRIGLHMTYLYSQFDKKNVYEKRG